MRGGSVSKTTPNPNERTISVLQEMATMYDQQKDQWRTRAYRQAISTLRVQTHRITTAAEAKLLPNISDRLADKIEEIATTNKLRRLESAKIDPEEAAIRMFAKIYGVGLSQVTKWVQAGYRSLEELLAANVPLSENQRIGIAHYDDFIARIPRAEVAMHGEIVRRALHAIDPSFEATVGGSYRRGAADSGDVDIVITKAGATAAYLRTVVIDTLVPELVKVGFLTAGLATTDKDSGSKWHGACQLPLPPSLGLSSSSSPEPRAKNVNTNPWRRIDLLLVPSDEIGAAMIYFTGNDIFNRSMRLLARRRGLRLNQRGLYKDVIRQGNTKLTEGVKIEGENERRIFEVLGVPWREATERNC
jgi:DNA polymerase IV